MKYRNPILPGFNPDPSICRVEDTFYLVTSSFEFFPGVPLCTSKNLVNWQLIGSIFDRLPGKEFETMERYGRGSWAPSFRYHNGCFYVYFCTPEEGLFMAKATDPAGEWTLRCIKEIAGCSAVLYLSAYFERLIKFSERIRTAVYFRLFNLRILFFSVCQIIFES